MPDLDTLIKAAGKSRLSVAQEMGVTKGTIGHWATRRNRIPSDRLSDLAAALRCDVDDIVGRPPPSRGMTDIDAAPWQPEPDRRGRYRQILAAIAPGRANLEWWRMNNAALSAAGINQGDLLAVDHGKETPIPGDVCLVQHHIADQGFRHFRLYRPPHLLPSSPDPSFGAFDETDESVAIMGRVVAVLRITGP